MALKEYKPGTTFPGRMGRTIGESHLGVAVPPSRPGGGRAERPFHRHRRHGLWPIGMLRFADQHAEHRQTGRERPALHRHAYDGALFALAILHADRPQDDHSNAMSCITEGSTGYPGGNGAIPFENGFLSEMLLQQGYATYCVGKWHLTPAEQVSAACPTTAGRSGVASSATTAFSAATRINLSRPRLRQPSGRAAENPRRGIPSDRGPRRQGDRLHRRPQAGRSRQAVLPLFRARREPCSSPRSEGIRGKYKGKFDEGWDVYREKVFARQKELGIMPKDAKLSRHDPDVQVWSKLPADELKLYARMMEVFAGFLRAHGPSRRPG